MSADSSKLNKLVFASALLGAIIANVALWGVGKISAAARNA